MTGISSIVGWTGVRVGLAVAVSASLWAASVQAQTAPMASPAPDPQATPKVGERARDFTLQSLDGSAVRLADEIARGPVVLVVLRGWPGYQCPFCTTQFSDYLKNAANFDARGAHVLFVYPGPAADLQEHAAAFLASRPMPQGFRFLLDPDYAMIGAYGLRWNAPKETSYPSTFVIDRHAMVAFAKTSRSHGDRVAADAVLTVLADSPR